MLGGNYEQVVGVWLGDVGHWEVWSWGLYLRCSEMYLGSEE